MININKQYGVNPTKWSYDLVHFVTDKNGNPSFEVVGYYHDFDAALNGYIALRTKKKLTQRDMSVIEAIKEIQSVRDEVKEIISGGDLSG